MNEELWAQKKEWERERELGLDRDPCECDECEECHEIHAQKNVYREKCDLCFQEKSLEDKYMKNAKEVRDYSVEKIDHFTKLLKESNNDFDIEAHLYAIQRVCEAAYSKVHDFNSSNPEKSEFKVFDRIFRSEL